MKKFCLIRQPAGLGDIISCQKIACKIIEKYNYPVIWPVIEQYKDIGNYINTGVWFPSVNDDFPGKHVYHARNVIDNDEILYLPIQDADAILNDLILKSKYKLVGLNYSDWYKYFKFNRNTSKENYLYYNILQLTDDTKYTLVSRKYGSLPEQKNWEIKFPTDLPVVEMNIINGFNLFDWCKVIENASKIYAIDSAINYFIEVLDLAATDIEITTRRPGYWGQIDYIFNKPFRKVG